MLPLATKLVTRFEFDRAALDKAAAGWLARLPMWDWVGGRTSVTSVVGLLPAALQGLDCAGLLGGAAAMDAWTRDERVSENPAALMALAAQGARLLARAHEGGGRPAYGRGRASARA